ASSYRRGLLSQGSILTLTYKGTHDSKPVSRGNYVLGKILCDAPKGAIPPNPELDESQLPPNYTFKDILALHRKNPDCAGCHRTMDPIGLAFDHFDGTGKFRRNYSATYKNLPVDTSESIYEKPFNSSYDMMEIFASSDKFYQCFSE